MFATKYLQEFNITDWFLYSTLFTTTPVVCYTRYNVKKNKKYINNIMLANVATSSLL